MKVISYLFEKNVRCVYSVISHGQTPFLFVVSNEEVVVSPSRYVEYDRLMGMMQIIFKVPHNV